MEDKIGNSEKVFFEIIRSDGTMEYDNLTTIKQILTKIIETLGNKNVNK